jgi:NAD(P)-dependent dehydrogenase (short-subunit alcohol dehydrogenase family)/acyl carrier protein
MTPKIADSTLEEEVISVFSKITRYPVEILDPDASLEEDLGIDSVKLGEVFSILREQYGLPQDMGLTPDMLRSIRSISIALEMHLGDRRTGAKMKDNGHSIPLAGSENIVGVHSGNGYAAPQSNHGHFASSGNGHPLAVIKSDLNFEAAAIATGPNSAEVNAGKDLLFSIQAVFSEVTRYPIEILDPQAQLEEDLGIDSVKLGEVFSVIRERYKLSDKTAVDPRQLKTIAGITEIVAQVTAPTAPPPSALFSLNGHAKAVDPLHEVKLEKARKELDGKVAYISGSGRGLGKDIAVYLAELGASVVVNSFHARAQGEQTVAEIKAAGGSAKHAWGSVANPEQLDGIFNMIEAEFGGLDFFISNASNGMLARLDQITPEHWEKAFRTNVVGLHQSSLRAVELMKKRGGGKIITLSSPASHGYVDYFGCMGAVKAAVESLTKSMAIEFAPFNIQVNCVSPGPIYGELLDKWPESKRLIAEWEDATVCGRLCESRDVSHFIAYLLGKDVKLFTGSVLVMDGGISVRWG